MNERIDELTFQAGITQHSYNNPKHPDLDGFIVSQEKLDRFAELIVRECIQAVYDDGQDAEYYQNRIKRRFGIEE